MENIVSVSADRPDPSIDEPTEAPSDEQEDGSTNKHRRDPTLIGIPQREPRRGGWFESGARSTDPRLKLPEFEEGEARSGWNSVADRPRKATESSFPGPRSKAPPPPSLSARSIAPSRKKRVSSTPPPPKEQAEASANVSTASHPAAEQEGFAALGDPDAKNERLPSLAPQRPSQELVGLSEPPAASTAIVAPPSAPPEYAATTIDSSPPDVEPDPNEGLLPGPDAAAQSAPGATDVPDAPIAPEDPTLESAKTTVDERAPELIDATPLAPIAAAGIEANAIAQAPVAPFQVDDDELSLRPPSSKRKWIIAVALLVAGIVGLVAWKLNSSPAGQPVHVIDKVAPPNEVPPETAPSEDVPTAESPTEAAGESAGSETTGSDQDLKDEPPTEAAESGEDRSLVEIMKAIEDANVPSQSRSIARMRVGAKARKARGHFSRATTHFRKKRYDRAIRYYVKALVFVPDHEEASEGIMHSLEAKGEIDKALSWSKRLVQLDSKNAMYWSYVGDLFRKLERPHDARVMYKRALEENRKNKAALAGLEAIDKH